MSGVSKTKSTFASFSRLITHDGGRVMLTPARAKAVSVSWPSASEATRRDPRSANLGFTRPGEPEVMTGHTSNLSLVIALRTLRGRSFQYIVSPPETGVRDGGHASNILTRLSCVSRIGSSAAQADGMNVSNIKRFHATRTLGDC